jgi:drug/metabolite transporter (DMT)-like permease
LGEGFGIRQIWGMFLAFAGLLHIIVKGHWSALTEVKFVAGDGWILAATLAWAGYALLQKKWSSLLGATARLAAICLGGVCSLIPFAIWEMMQPGLNKWDSQALALVVVAAIVPGVGAYWIYGWTQKILGANRVAVSLYLVPLYVSVVAWWVLGELPGWHHVVGAAMILPGVYLVTRIKPLLQARS